MGVADREYVWRLAGKMAAPPHLAHLIHHLLHFLLIHVIHAGFCCCKDRAIVLPCWFWLCLCQAVLWLLLLICCCLCCFLASMAAIRLINRILSRFIVLLHAASGDFTRTCSAAAAHNCSEE